MPDLPNAFARLPTIRRYLLQRIVGIIIFSFFAFAAAAWLVVVRPAQSELARVEMGRAADRVEADIGALTDQIERLLTTARDWGRTGVVRIDRPEDFARLMIPVLRSRPEMSQALLANERGDAVLFGREGSGWLIRVIDSGKTGAQQHWTHLDAQGNPVGEESVSRVFDPRTRPWFQGAMATSADGDMHWTNPYEFFESQQPGITAAMRWTDPDGGLRHVIAFDVLLLDLSRYTSLVKVGESGQAAILTADGQLLALPRDAGIGLEADLHPRFLQSPREAGLTMLASAYDQWLADGRPAARASFYSVGTESWIGRFRPFPLRNLHLLIATVAPRSDFTLGTAWDVAAIGAMMLGVLTLAWLTGLGVSRRFSNVVASLAHESERIGNLQLDHPVTIEPHVREIGRLVSAQDQMRRMLIDATGELEARVQARTAEQVVTMQRLQALAQEQELLLANVQVGILFTGESHILRVNPKLAEIFGYADPQDMQGLPSSALFPTAAEFERFSAEAAPALASGKALDIEWRGARRDHSTFLGHTIARAIRVPGQRFATIWFIEDITARRAAEHEVSELTAFLQAMIDRIPNAVFYKGPDTRFMGCNMAYQEMFGVSRDRFVGKRVLDLEYLPLADRAAFQAEDEAVLAAASSAHREEVMPFADGRLHHTLYSVSGFRRQDGSPGGLVGVIVDVEPLKQAESALRSANAEQLAIFESAGAGIAFVRDRTIQRCNHKLDEIFGYAAGELSGQPTRVWYTSDADYEKGRDAIDAHLELGEIHRRDQRLRRKDGSMFWCRLSGRSVEPGDPSRGNVWMLEDVTDERAAAGALREAKRIAEEATLAKSMFLANMSHEIRTPMNAIIGLSHLALKTELTPRQRDYVSKVHGAGTSLLGIINDILDYSKVEAGRLEVERAPFRLDDVLDHVSSLVAQKTYDKGLELLFDTAHDVPQVLVGDALRLGQIITNLVSNAVKFTERGQVSVTVRQLAHAGHQVQLRFDVRDTGIGMTDEQAARLFHAFTQADGSTTRKYGGTGLGLTISKRLVELMEGSIQVESMPSVGSLFWFTARFGLEPGPTRPGKVIPALLHGIRALLVDDNATVREVLGSQLSTLGLVVSAVDSGEAALQALRQSGPERPFGVAVVDWSMPGMDGIETVRRMRQLQQRPLHTIMATAFGHDELRASAEEAGVEAFLVKPVSQSSLVDALMSVFAPQAGAAARAVASDAGIPRLHGVRLLLAEDNAINQQIAVELLEGAGATVMIAADGPTVVRMVEDGGPGAYDAVLMDLQMPGMDGIEATQRIRADLRFTSLPIIAMTAHAMADERERCAAAGMVDHISKPIDPHAMFHTLARWVRPDTAGNRDDAGQPRAGTREPEEGQEPVPDIAGLDAASGLRRVAGNRVLYLSLLRQFAQRQADAPARIDAALLLGQRDVAERIAHTVRGVAGNIGLGAVEAAAAALEKVLTSGADVRDAAAAFQTAQASAVSALNEALAGAPAAPRASASSADLSQAGQHANHIASLLASSDGEAVDYLLAHHAALGSLFAESAFPRFRRSVQDFDFEAALEQLHTATGAPGPQPASGAGENA